MTEDELSNLARQRDWRAVLAAVDLPPDSLSKRFRLWARLATGQFTEADAGDLRALLTGPIAPKDWWSLWRLRSVHGRTLEALVPTLHAQLVEAAWREGAPAFHESFLSAPLLGVLSSLPRAWGPWRVQLGGSPAQVDPERRIEVMRWLVDALCDLEDLGLSDVDQHRTALELVEGKRPALLPELAASLEHTARETAPWEHLGRVLATHPRTTADAWVTALDAMLLHEDVLAHLPSAVDAASLAGRIRRVVFRKTPLRALECALVELEGQRLGLLRRESPIAEYTWHEGPLDEVLATVSDRRFEEAVSAVLELRQA